mgnify:CR=1 FL=1
MAAILTLRKALWLRVVSVVVQRRLDAGHNKSTGQRLRNQMSSRGQFLKGSVQFLIAVMAALIDWDQREAKVHSSAKIRTEDELCGN